MKKALVLVDYNDVELKQELKKGDIIDVDIERGLYLERKGLINFSNLEIDIDYAINNEESSTPLNDDESDEESSTPSNDDELDEESSTPLNDDGTVNDSSKKTRKRKKTSNSSKK